MEMYRTVPGSCVIDGAVSVGIFDDAVAGATVWADPFLFRKGDPQILIRRMSFKFLDSYLGWETS